MTAGLTQGDAGAQSPAGPQGAKGDTGPAGPQGPAGESTISGGFDESGATSPSVIESRRLADGSGWLAKGPPPSRHAVCPASTLMSPMP
jgi:hypothetical protein